MKKLLRRCNQCHVYSLEMECKHCDVRTIYPHPPKFSPDDKYVRLRLAERYKS